MSRLIEQFCTLLEVILYRNFKLTRQEISVLDKQYKFFGKKSHIQDSIVLFAMDGTFSTAGLADLLRGMISAYAYSKVLELPYRIIHKIPFVLEDYLIPNKYNWLPESGEISNSIFSVRPIVRMNKDKREIPFTINGKKQIHIYTNTDFLPIIEQKFGIKYNYHKLYNELFKPSELLQQEVDKSIPNIPFISISFRFTQLLGDFKDVVGKELTESQQQELIQKSHQIIDTIYKRHDNAIMVLVTSDSQKFIDSLKGIKYVFTLPGKIGQIGYNTDKATHLKTFLDFYAISKAQKVYLAYSEGMWKSNFSRAAAEITGTEFEIVEY